MNFGAVSGRCCCCEERSKVGQADRMQVSKVKKLCGKVGGKTRQCVSKVLLYVRNDLI